MPECLWGEFSLLNAPAVQLREYDDVDPLQVLQLNLLCLGYSLTPQRVAAMRRLDPRVLPFFAVYAVVDGIAAAQVIVFRLPVVLTSGPAEVGGVGAVCTHPAYRGRGLAAMLLEVAHARLRALGLHYSTLGTARHRGAYRLYSRLGYADAPVPYATALARHATAARPTPLRAGSAGLARLPEADRLFEQLAAGRLGFARRHAPFFSALAATGNLSPHSVWFLAEGGQRVGYAITEVSEVALKVTGLLLADGVEAALAVAALATESALPYVQVRVARPCEAGSLRRAGYELAQPDYGAFMVKPLAPGATPEAFAAACALGSDQFLISGLDIT